nr:pimeloyl-ACP methyl ester esterase BioH [Salinimonas chungwhensis]
MHNCTKNTDLITRTQGTGKDLVLLHGWGMNSGVFKEFSPLLSDEYSVTVIDLPGFGENHSVAPTDYTIAGLAEILAPVLPANCILAGWSMGGLVAQQLALSMPEKVMGLVTIASSPRFASQQGWPGIEPALLQQFQYELGENFAKTLDRFLAIQTMGCETARKDVKTIKHSVKEYPQPSVETLKASLELLSNEDLRRHVGQIKQPTLRIYGRLDSLVPKTAIDSICQLHPQSDAVVLSGASHAPFISHPKQTADIIKRFVTTRVS